jgi:glycosyltransferase involved in cell wall biosynthesis
VSPVFGIDARAATEEGAGGGRVVRELLRALAARGDDHRYMLYARRAWDEPLDDRFTWRLVAARDPLWHARVAVAANRSCDAFLSTNSYLTPWALRIPCAPVVFDLVAFDRALRPQPRSGIIERLTMGHAVRRSAALIAISHATADALVTRFPAAAGKIEVAPLGVSPALEPATELPARAPAEGFVLAVGTLEPRKNLPRLVDAFASLPEELQKEHPLVVVGRLGWGAGETLRALERLGDRCRLLGFVPDDVLAALYRRCAVFCYPSLGEGFGLPVLEAMQAGAPVLTADRSSLPEVGGDAVAYCDPTSVASIAAALEALLRDQARRAELAELGRERAREFSWARTAEITLGVLERIAAEAGVRRAPGDLSGPGGPAAGAPGA